MPCYGFYRFWVIKGKHPPTQIRVKVCNIWKYALYWVYINYYENLQDLMVVKIPVVIFFLLGNYLHK